MDGQMDGRTEVTACGRQKLSNEVLVWLSVLGEVHMTCSPADATAIPSSLIQ